MTRFGLLEDTGRVFALDPASLTVSADGLRVTISGSKVCDVPAPQVVRTTFNGMAREFPAQGIDALGVYYDTTNVALGEIITAQGPQPSSAPLLNGTPFPSAPQTAMRLHDRDSVTWS